MYITNPLAAAKKIPEIIAFHENAQGTDLSYQLDDWDKDKWEPIATLDKAVYGKYSLDARRFQRIRFKISGTSDGADFIWRTLEVINLLTDG